MRKSFIKFTSFVLLIAMLIPGAVACQKETTDVEKQDIVVLFTANNNGAISENIGYDGLTAYKYEVKGRTDNVALVDLGNSFGSDSSASVDKIIDLMNRVGYDFGVIGGNELELGLLSLNDVIKYSNMSYLGCNISYTGAEKNLLNKVKPYTVVEYDTAKVAFIGVSAPDTDELLCVSEKAEYNFNLANENEFYSCVQGYVEECNKLGADYVIVLSNFSETEDSDYNYEALAENTFGVSAILDASADSVAKEYENKNGNSVIVAGAGENFESIGELVITPNGAIEVNIVSDYDKKDSSVNSFIGKTNEAIKEESLKVVGNASFEVSLNDENGKNVIKTRETPIGNLCADAYRYVCDADVGFVAGAEISKGIDKGEITVSSLSEIMPSGYKVCKIEATGEDIINALDMACKDLSNSEYAPDKEFDGFLQVAGLKYTIIGIYTTGVELDENGMYVGLQEGSVYRVEDVMILQSNGTYEPIDPEKIYTVAASNYLVKQNGYGYTMFEDCKILEDSVMYDYQALEQYISVALEGNILDKYEEALGRISIRRTKKK